MSGVRGNTVTNPADPKQNKDAVDAIYNFYTPQYLVLVGSVDVIPHQRMVNPAPDEDPAVPSGLPYACASPYSQETGDFVGPSRVVSRRYIDLHHEVRHRSCSVAHNQPVAEVERLYTEGGQPSLGEAFRILRQQWLSGSRERDIALHLFFLAWYSFIEPPYLTGLTDLGDPAAVFRDIYEFFGERSEAPGILAHRGQRTLLPLVAGPVRFERGAPEQFRNCQKALGLNPGPDACAPPEADEILALGAEPSGTAAHRARAVTVSGCRQDRLF